MSNENEDLPDGAAVLASLESLLYRFKRSIMMDLRVMAPARVLLYDAVTQRASVVLESLPIKSLDGEPIPQPPITLTPCPVSFYRGMGGLAYQAFPLIPGDTGMVIFSDRDLSQWATNPTTSPLDPISGALHSLSGGVFVPGIHKDTDVPLPVTDAHVIAGPLVRLGTAGTEFALRGTSVAAAAAAAQTALSAVPPAADPATVITLCNANTAAILALTAVLTAAVSTTVQIQ